MQQRIMALVAPLFVLSLLTAGCGGGSSSGVSLAESAAGAMGGAATLRSVQTQTVTSAGLRFEPEQTFAPGDPPRQVSGFQAVFTRDLIQDRLRIDWLWDVQYPFVAQLQYAEVIDGRAGFIDGADSLGGPAQATMPAARQVTLRRLQRMSSPLELVLTALDDPTVTEAPALENFRGRTHRVLILPAAVSPLRLFIDAQTLLPAKAETLEDDPYYGDTRFEVVYEDWRPVDGILLPFRITHLLEGHTLQSEQRSTILINPPLAAGIFAVPANLISAFDAADALRAEFSAQWFFRRQALGLPDYADQSLNVVLTDIAPGVVHVTGGSHHSLIVEMADHLVLVEAPLDEARSRAVIAAAAARFPGKPFRFAVNTHFHLDHGGGIRAYGAEGAAIIVGEASRLRFEEIMQKPHTLRPDRLQLQPRVVTVEGVTDLPRVITDGTATLEVYPVINTHSADMVIAFIPAGGLVFVSDLFSPQGDFFAADLPVSLTDTFTRFGLNVQRIAGGHGTVGSLLPPP
jgi:glyoxylase-like metal-dependent hydrolase (beta-lactamase superfamily II)